ncbi:RidA family protein [Raoultella terrigena]|uniref:Endoribonuclease L-PSP n=1 Tax=Raoultella terrigena TaxID=577 RepID=A0A7Z8ZA83_RAOTE|nr:endoribonuclease L-PSP [Raoultella terrigena]
MGTEIVLNEAKSAPPAGHYSHSCSAGGFVWISGQLPVTPNGEKIADAPFEEQVRQVLSNLDACLAGAGVTRRELVSVRVYVTDIGLWPEFNKVYAEWIEDYRPSRAVAGVSELHYGAALEVEAVALAPAVI